jgi:hypothetical protein
MPWRVGGADALVHHLGNVRRLQVPFLGDCPDTAPNCVHRICAVPIKPAGGRLARGIRQRFLRFFADFICHDRAALAALITFTTSRRAPSGGSTSIQHRGMSGSCFLM